MNFHPGFKKAIANFFILGSLIWATAPAQATALAIAEQPLFLLGSVDPNIMLMVDNSGSMQNIVPDVPYDPDFPYLPGGCPTTDSNRVAAGTAVEISVVSGTPMIRIVGTTTSTSTNYPWGTGSGKRCFEPNFDYTNVKLHADSPVGTGASGYLGAQYKGNYLNWYFDPSKDPSVCPSTWVGARNTWSGSGKKPCTLSRIEIAKSASKSLIDNLGAGNRVGFSTYNNGVGGSLREAIDSSLTTAKRTSIKAKIDALSASGNTPLAETLSDIGRYFTTGYPDTNSLTLHPGQPNQSNATIINVFSHHSIQNSSGISPLPSPVQFFCQKNFAVMLTDGRPQFDQEIESTLCDYDGDSGGNCSNFDKKAGQQYESLGSDFLDDVAKALFEIDLRPDLSDPNGVGDDKNNLRTYMIGFADDQVINDPLMNDTAANGGGLFLQAGNSQSLIQAFDTIAATIKRDRPSAAALAANSTSLEVGAVVFQAIFDSSDWSGDLIAFPVGTDGLVATGSPFWKAGSLLLDASTRRIYTIKAGNGVDFLWTSLSAAQQAALNTQADGTPDTVPKGGDRLDWIRGVHDKEVRKPAGEFRNRERTLPDSSKQEWILGDIVNSDPVFMQQNDFGYETMIASEASSYALYKADKSDSKPVIFIGGNDGMLHAFRADTADNNSGKELFAYVPDAVYANLSKLPAVDYSHSYFVDGGPALGDVYFGGAWHTVLVSGLGAGGKSVFALDVTEFAIKPPDVASPSANTVVKWEFTDSDMGFSYSKPQIARLNNGVWAAIFGNGYNSASEQAYLYVINIETGAIIKKIAVGVPGSNGLSSPVLYDANGDKIIDYVYAGDLQGNLWKFDLCNETNGVCDSLSTTNWDVAYGGQPLFKARNVIGQVQPITAQPVLGTAPTVIPAPTEPGIMVYFGTGRYLQNVDISDVEKQSFYGIWDNGSIIAATNRSTLQQQNIVSTGVNFGATLRTTSANTVEWNTERGWYMDFDVQGEPGERVVTQALLRFDRVIFLTLIPSTVECVPGGASWLMELDAKTGAKTSEPNFDFNNDGVFDSDDQLAGSVVSGYRTTVGITKPPAWFTGRNGKDFKVMTGTSGGIESLGNRPGPPPVPGAGGVFRRTYWLQIQ